MTYISYTSHIHLTHIILIYSLPPLTALSPLTLPKPLLPPTLLTLPCHPTQALHSPSIPIQSLPPYLNHCQATAAAPVSRTARGGPTLSSIPASLQKG